MLNKENTKELQLKIKLTGNIRIVELERDPEEVDVITDHLPEPEVSYLDSLLSTGFNNN